MKHLSELQLTLSYFLDWNKARLNCLVQILQALFYVRTVNLTQIAEAFHADTKKERWNQASMRMLKRFSMYWEFQQPVQPELSTNVVLKFSGITR